MANRKFRIELCCLMIGLFVLFVTPSGFATDGDVLKTQGLVNPGGNPKTGSLIINEMVIYIDKTTKVMDHREMPILITELTPKRWVYMEVEKEPNGNTIKARKIYLLPHYINPEERKKFPFMN